MLATKNKTYISFNIAVNSTRNIKKGQKRGVTCTRAAHMSDAEQTGRSKTLGAKTEVIKMLTAVTDFSKL